MVGDNAVLRPNRATLVSAHPGPHLTPAEIGPISSQLLTLALP